VLVRQAVLAAGRRGAFMRWAINAAAALTAAMLAGGVCLPAGAAGVPTVGLRAGLHPEHLGHTTTVTLDMRIDPGGEGAGEVVPPPLTEVSLRYPAGLDITLSGLGIDTCSAATLEFAGPPGCPADSWMGEGEAVAELPIHHAPFREDAKVAILRGPEADGHLAMLFYLYGETAVRAQIILQSQLLPAARPFGGQLDLRVPLVPGIPEGPDVSVGELSFVLGPPGLTYYERVHDRVVPYTPNGIRLPERCPRGGFAFALALSFLGGERAAAKTAVPCPRRAGRRR